MIEKIIYPDWISKKMCARFDNLEFCVDCDGFLYSPKGFNDDWDFQTKALYYRSINMPPDMIAKKLNLNVNTLKNKEFLGLITLDYKDKNYKLRDTSIFDWCTIGYNSIKKTCIINKGGAQDIDYHGKIVDDGGLDVKISPQLEMDGELNQILHDQPDQNTILSPSQDLFKKYYGDYEN